MVPPYWSDYGYSAGAVRHHVVGGRAPLDAAFLGWARAQAVEQGNPFVGAWGVALPVGSHYVYTGVDGIPSGPPDNAPQGDEQFCGLSLEATIGPIRVYLLDWIVLQCVGADTVGLEIGDEGFDAQELVPGAIFPPPSGSVPIPQVPNFMRLHPGDHAWCGPPPTNILLWGALITIPDAYLLCCTEFVVPAVAVATLEAPWTPRYQRSPRPEYAIAAATGVGGADAVTALLTAVQLPDELYLGRNVLPASLGDAGPEDEWRDNG